jgi:transposase
MPQESRILGLPGYDIQKMEGRGRIIVEARHDGPPRCPFCQGQQVRTKGRFTRRVRHTNCGLQQCWLALEARKYQCRSCGRYFNQRFPGIGRWRRSTEPFRYQVFRDHHQGICSKTLAEREGLGSATVERWSQDFLKRKVSERSSERCPRILGIDEQFFTRRLGFATTLCDLEHHKVYDVVLGRSEAALEGYFKRLRGKDQVRVVCMDLSGTYRAVVRKHFPRAVIVADRFHVIRLVNHQFLMVWRQLDAVGSKNRGLVSLMRRHENRLSQDQRQRLQAYLQTHPALAAVYAFKQRLTGLLCMKTCTLRTCRKRLIPLFMDFLHQLQSCGLQALEQLARTLGSWREEIARMWRFTKNNGITEGFHNKMEMIKRRAFGFRNFQNYRLRVRALCA